MSKADLIEWLVNWRESVKGSRSPWNLRRELRGLTKVQLQKKFDQINAAERAGKGDGKP